MLFRSNNEIGTIQPIKEIAEIAHKHGVWMHTDAVQAVGTIQMCIRDRVYTNAFAEAQEAMDYLHQNAGDLHIDPEQIAVVGFSAGGHSR